MPDSDTLLLKILERLADNVERLAQMQVKQAETIAALAELARDDRLQGRRLADAVGDLTTGMERLQTNFAIASKERIAEGKKRVAEFREALAEKGRS